MAKRKTWPTIEEMVENARKGLIDDAEDAVPAYELSEDEILGQPPEPVPSPRPADAPPKPRAA